MKRFVILSFLVMGWGYYELSGGSDFVPERRTAVAAVAAPEPAAEQAPASTVTTTAEEPVIADASATDPLDGVPVVARADTQDLEALPERESPAEEAISFEAGSVAEALAQALEETAASPEAAETTAEPDQLAAAPSAISGEIRSVSADTVNLRDGPGTNFNVLERLTRGTLVALLESGPDGWVYVEVNGRTGWMSSEFIGPAT